MNKAIIVTTIHSPSKAIRQFSKIKGWNLISVGDLKTAKDWHIPHVNYLSPEDQDKLFPKFSKILRWNRYARKNIGYLYAIMKEMEIIAEIDDDIEPYKNYPHDISKIKIVPTLGGSKFVNIYYFFNGGKSWPRGFPLNFIKQKNNISIDREKVFTPIQNSILDQNGDFDAIYRLISDQHIKYKKSGQYGLKSGVYCPFHSGNTIWHKEAFMLLYLPTFVNPHVEDIWRGYIAQRLIWEIGGTLTFIYPTAYTKIRNAHSYMNDFKNELPLFFQTEELISVLDNLSLSKSLGESLIQVYKALVKKGIMQEEEISVVESWVDQVHSLF